MTGGGRGFHLQLLIIHSMLNIALLLTAQSYWAYCFRKHADGILPTLHYHIVTKQFVNLMQEPIQRRKLYLYSNNWPNLTMSSFKGTIETKKKSYILIYYLFWLTEEPALYQHRKAKCDDRKDKQKGGSRFLKFPITYVPKSKQILRRYTSSSPHDKRCNKWASSVFMIEIWIASLTGLLVKTSFPSKFVMMRHNMFFEQRLFLSKIFGGISSTSSQWSRKNFSNFY